MHDQTVQHVLRAPLAFFHTNPTGRILNRFSKDQGTADDHLPQVAFDATQSLFLVAGKPSPFSCALPCSLKGSTRTGERHMMTTRLGWPFDTIPVSLRLIVCLHQSYLWSLQWPIL